jgi:hypothetical protein
VEQARARPALAAHSEALQAAWGDVQATLAVLAPLLRSEGERERSRTRAAELELLYGRGTLPLRLPDDLDVTVIRKPAMPVLPSAADGVRAALAAPVASSPLREAARGKRTACILVCDITRPVPNGLLLGPIVRELLEAGVPKAGITVLDTVPTLLSLLPGDIPGLRVIILGGEACPAALAERWCRPGRRIFNSYGPTEATVVATMAEVRPGETVTIGGPIPNYACWVVDDTLGPVAPGAQGWRRSQSAAARSGSRPFTASSTSPGTR